jgi:hypothetical protein
VEGRIQPGIALFDLLDGCLCLLVVAGEHVQVGEVTVRLIAPGRIGIGVQVLLKGIHSLVVRIVR